jgi:hypothetical protein
MLVLRAAEKGLEIACRIAPDIPDYLQGDPGRIQQVLVNLLGNAVKFTAGGEIFLTVSVESMTPARARLHFSVSDTGMGMNTPSTTTSSQAAPGSWRCSGEYAECCGVRNCPGSIECPRPDQRGQSRNASICRELSLGGPLEER